MGPDPMPGHVEVRGLPTGAGTAYGSGSRPESTTGGVLLLPPAGRALSEGPGVLPRGGSGGDGAHGSKCGGKA